MNKKQAVIIVTLMVLIVCAGVLATRVRSPLYVNDSDFNSDSSNKSTVSLNNDTKKSSSKSDIFAEGRLEREQKDQREIQTLKNIIDDKNVSNETKSSAQQKMMALTDEDAKSNKVETMLESKGFKEALCSITDSKVTITVKCDNDKLTDNQLRNIKEVVTDVTKIRNIEVLQPVH